MTTGHLFCPHCSPCRNAERVNIAERERDVARSQVALLVRVIKTVQSLSTMTNEQLAELQAACKKVMVDG